MTARVMNNNHIMFAAMTGLSLSILIYYIVLGDSWQAVTIDVNTLANFVLLAGITITLMICGFIYTLRNRQALMRQQMDNQVAALDYSERKYKAILDTALDSIVTIDKNGIVASFNPAAEKLFGYQADEIIGKNVNTLMPEPYREEHDAYLASYQESGKAKIIGTGREVTGRRKDGSEFPMELAVSEIHLGEQVVFAGLVRDITDRKQAENELVIAKTMAERASKAKSEFLSSMSHELRTPLNAILGYSRLFQYDQNLSAQQKNNAVEINNAGEHLLSLIDRVLDLEKIESGAVDLVIEPVSLASVFDECEKLVSSLALSRGINLDFSVPECGAPFIKADYVRLKHIFLNLLSNAILYNRENGRVKVDCAAGEGNTVRVRVTDTGSGIPEDKMDGLFQPFNHLGAGFSDTGVRA